MLSEHENHERRPGEGAASNVVADDTPTVPLTSAPPACLCGYPRAGLLFDEGRRRRCEACASPQELHTVEWADERAPGLGLTKTPARYAEWGHTYQWPYGPNIHVEARARLVTWAEKHGLRASSRSGHHCLSWLVTGRCTWRCAVAGGRVAPFLDKLDGDTIDRWSWLDHVTTWTDSDRSPAVLVAQPYWISGGSLELLDRIDAHPQLRVELASEGSWYGMGTWSVTIWRADR